MENLMLQFLKVYYKVFSMLFPVAAARSAFLLFQKPRNKKLKKREKTFYETWNAFSIDSEIGPIPCYDKGDPEGDLVFLVHGWDSNAGSMSGIGNALADSGYYVITFDLPGHGKSSLKYGNLYVGRTTLLTLLKKFRSDKPVSIVSHSFGSAVTAFSLSKSDIAVNQLLFLTSPNSIKTIFRDFQALIGLSDPAYDHLLRMAFELVQEDIENIKIMQRLSWVNYQNLTLIHDRFDKILPFKNAQLMADYLPNTELIPFDKIGHYRMLWNEEVIRTILEKLNPEELETIKSRVIDPFQTKNGKKPLKKRATAIYAA